MADCKTAVFLLSLTFMQRFRKENLTFEQFAVVKSNVILDHRCRRRVICFCPGLEEVIAGPKIKLFKWRKLATQGKLSVAKKWNSKFWSPKISLTPLKRESKAASYRHQLSFVLIRRGWKLVMYQESCSQFKYVDRTRSNALVSWQMSRKISF